MLRVENVSMIYGDRAVLRDVSVHFKESTIVSITGKSGAGKSTLLGVLSGLMKPHRGKIFYMDQDVFRWGDFKRAHFRSRTMGFVFQFYNLFPDMTAYENILYPASLNRHSPSDIRKEINSLAELLGISHILKQDPATLSGGERQRVAIARAVINNPRLILADEPTGNLDENTTSDITDLFIKLKKERGITTIIATHESSLVERSDVIYHVEDGAITEIKAENRIQKKSAKAKSAGKKKVEKK